jgi:coproporphyrinogen III oxidase
VPEHRYASSPRSQRALALVEELQANFVQELSKAQVEMVFDKTSWLRDQGQHGGGTRYGCDHPQFFNRSSINVSQVHYDDDPEKKLSSATAISSIIHPHSPHMPSIHVHISWTEIRDGHGYWRMMADLNPSLDCDWSSEFLESIQQVSGEHHAHGVEQGDHYFFIPALNRHRGVAHFYLENFHRDDFESDLDYARSFGKSVIGTYTQKFESITTSSAVPTTSELKSQLDYHTLYFFQVLTLDKGTTSGLLIHDQNDIGILGSLPSHVNLQLLKIWVGNMPAPQDLLLEALIDVFPERQETGHVDDDIKIKCASVLREHYKKHPEALKLQAAGFTQTQTVNNHR